MYEVFRHWDTATVGLVNGLLEDAWDKTILRNWEGSNIVEIPIPVIYPNVCVLTKKILNGLKTLFLPLCNHLKQMVKIGIVKSAEKRWNLSDFEGAELWRSQNWLVCSPKKAVKGTGEESVEVSVYHFLTAVSIYFQ